ncbi:MAG: hypothetical protein AB2722_12615 [Candidatus Thiodiazotropha sp.]
MDLNWIQKIMLLRLLKKESPDSYKTSSPEEEQMDYDFIYVHGSTKEHKDALILSWDESKDLVNYMWWPEDAHGVRGTDATCASSDLIWEALNVRQRYRTWDIRYSTIRVAYLHDVLHLPLIKWRLQKIRNLFLRPVDADYRIKLLKTIVKMHDNQEPITTHELLAKIHGSAIRLSSEYYRLQKNLEFLLDSLKDSGDIVHKDEEDPIHFFGYGTIAPAPKSLSTIATYNEDHRRHKDMIKMSGKQLWVGWAMFALAAVTLIVELGKQFNIWK